MDGSVSDGGVVSRTAIVWMQLVLLPQASVAVHVREIVRLLPHPAVTASVKRTVTVPQPSVAVAVPVEAGEVSAVHSTVISCGQLNVGLVVS